MAIDQNTVHAKEGDWLEVHGRPGRAPRRGQILEVLGAPGHERFRVRWDEVHESIFFPTEGVSILRRQATAGRSPGRATLPEQG